MSTEHSSALPVESIPRPEAKTTLTSLRDYHDIAVSAPPRDLARIWNDIQNEVKFAPETAELAWYSMPYRDKGKIVPVEGIGINGIMVIARHWGFCYRGGTFGDDLGDKFVARGRFVDLRTMVPIERDVVAHRFQRTKNGDTYRLEGKHWENACQSAISKAQRNAAIKGIPAYIQEKFFELVKRLTLEEKNPAQRALPVKEKIAKARDGFVQKWGSQGLTPELFDEYVSGLSVENDDALYAHLRGLFIALRTGDETVASAFGVSDKARKVPSMPQEKK